MRPRGGGAGERALGVLLRLYPASFREEYGPEIVAVYRRQRDEARHGGAGGRLRLWGRVIADLVPAAVRERAASWGTERARRRAADPFPPPYGEAAVAGLAVWTLYVATLAPTIAFWDAGEYATVSHIVGVPHPPGNPLFVFLSRSWELLLAPLGLAPVTAVNLFSATASALTHVFWFLVADRLLAARGGDGPFRRVGAWAAVALSATAYTVWSQSNVNEKVYTLSLLTVGLVSWLALRWRDGRGEHGRRSPRSLLLAGYVLVLSATSHLMGLLAAPALLLFVLQTDARPLARGRFWAAAVALGALALSAQLFLPIRSDLKPLVLQAEPACETLGEAAVSVYTWGGAGCEALSASLRREQYAKPPLLADPTDPDLPRGPRLVAAQLLNYLQYFDWQWARSVAGTDEVLGGARPLITLLFLVLGLTGLRAVLRRDRGAGVYMVVLFLTLSVGLVAYLNFKYGWSIAREAFPSPDDHEVRERDYFFLIGFSVWGVCAGIGLAEAWQSLAERLSARPGAASGRARLAAAPLLALAVVPLALNWSWASRADDWTARDWAYNVLMSVEPYGILVTNGDNDSYPLWYAQKVEGIREDVTIVLTPYLDTAWYPKQLRALTAPCPPGLSAETDPTRILCQRAFDPAGIPAPLVRRGMAGGSVRAPDDTIFPLDDEAIDAIAATAYVAPRDLRLRAGAIDTVIPAGTVMFPRDSFIGVLLQANLGERPVHFMAPSSSLGKLGLQPYAVRQGVTIRINDGPPRVGPDTGIVRLPGGSLAEATAPFVDLPRTDTLLREVYIHRGRILDADAPWTDPANPNIPLYYAWAHLAAAQAYDVLAKENAVADHVAEFRRWEAVVAD